MPLNWSHCSSPSCSHPPPHESQRTCWAIFLSASSEHAALQPRWTSHSSWSCTFPFLGFARVFFPSAQLSLWVQIQLHSWKSTSMPPPLWRLSWSCLSTLQGDWAFLCVYVIPNGSVSSLGLLLPSPWYYNDVRACLSSPTRLGSPCSQERDHFQVWTPPCLGCCLVIWWVSKNISEWVLVGTGDRRVHMFELQIKLTVKPKLNWQCHFEARLDRNANKYIQRKVDQKEKSLALGCNPGDQEGRYKGKDSVCLMPGNRNCQQKLEVPSSGGTRWIIRLPLNP